MNILRHVVIPAAAAAALILPSTAFAQQAPSAPAPASSPGQWQGHRGHGGYMRMMRGLNLSDQQHARIRQIMQQYRQAHPRGSRPDPQARAQLRTQIMNVLTPQQQTQLKQQMQQMRERRAETAPTPQP